MNMHELKEAQAKVQEYKDAYEAIAGTASPTGPKGTPYDAMLGKSVFIRTVTHHYTGILREVHEQELVLEDAAWIASDGRFADTLRKGAYDEVEPYPEGRVIIGRGALLDCVAVSGEPPRVQR